MSLPYDPVVIWANVKALTGATECTFDQVMFALQALGYSEGAVDGIFDTIRESGVCAVDDEWNFKERTGKPTKFVFCCDLCGHVLGVAHLRSFAAAARRHRKRGEAWPSHAGRRGKIRYHCLSQPAKKFCSTTPSGPVRF